MLGSAERTRSAAINKQVFYYTNIAPQYSSGYNTGGGGWNTLEDWIDGKVCRDTTYLVIGTYFESYTDGYGMSASPKKIEFGGRSDVSCPTMFYIAALRTKRGDTGKSVLNCSADEPDVRGVRALAQQRPQGPEGDIEGDDVYFGPRKAHRTRILHQRVQRPEEYL